MNSTAVEGFSVKDLMTGDSYFNISEINEKRRCESHGPGSFAPGRKDPAFVLRNDNDYFVPRTNLTFVQKMPLIDFPLTWNRIDQSLKEISSKLLFKKTIKLELLDEYRDLRCTRTICISCMDIESVL